VKGRTLTSCAEAMIGASAAPTVSAAAPMRMGEPHEHCRTENIIRSNLCHPNHNLSA
jgi:hypothetical protein